MLSLFTSLKPEDTPTQPCPRCDKNLTKEQKRRVDKQLCNEYLAQKKENLKQKKKAELDKLTSQAGADSIWGSIKKVLSRLNKSPSAILVVAGCALWFAGHITSEGFPFANDIFTITTLSALLNGMATIIIVGGVFGFIINSDQFEKAHRDNLFKILNEPEVIIDTARLEKAWMNLTESRIKKLLPKTYHHAAELINSQFFKADEKYQFDGYKASYNIYIEPGTSIAKITVTTKATIVFCPGNEDFVIEQKQSKRSNYKLLRYKIGTETVYESGDDEELTGEDGNSAGEDEQSNKKDKPTIKNENFVIVDIDEEGYSKKSIVNLKDFSSKFDIDKDNEIKSVYIERVVSYSQDIAKDPVASSTLQRFIKGNLTIRIKINEDSGYNFYLSKSGGMIEDHHVDMDDDYHRYELIGGGNQTLALPGQSFTIFISKAVTK